jgi:hypothetical protein
MEIIFDTRSEKSHKDILLKISNLDLEQYVDSYYFGIDDSNDQTVSVKSLYNFRMLLGGWAFTVKGMSIGGVAFLPFDFSDEYIGCLRVEVLEENLLRLQYGCTRKYTGYMLSPVNDYSLEMSDEDFIPSSDFIVESKDEFIRCLENIKIIR